MSSIQDPVVRSMINELLIDFKNEKCLKIFDPNSIIRFNVYFAFLFLKMDYETSN